MDKNAMPTKMVRLVFSFIIISTFLKIDGNMSFYFIMEKIILQLRNVKFS